MYEDLSAISASIDVDHLCDSLDVKNFAPIMKSSEVLDFFDDLSRQFLENPIDSNNHYINETSVAVKLEIVKIEKAEIYDGSASMDGAFKYVSPVKHNHNADAIPSDGNNNDLAKKRYEKCEIIQLECYLCQRKFNRLAQLQTHMRTHTEKKPFPCSLCPRKFTRKIYLQLHLRVHIGKALFRCSDCGKRLFRESKARKVKKSSSWRY